MPDRPELTLVSTVLGTPDPGRLADFYHRLVGWPVATDEPDWVTLRPTDGGAPWHSRQYQSLPPVYVQNASLEIAWSRVVTELHSISGDVVSPFLTAGDEGFDINNMNEWWLAQHMLASGTGTVPEITEAPFHLPEPAAQ